MHLVLTCDTEKLVNALAPLNTKERAFLAERADDFQYKTYCAAIAQQELADAFPGVYEEFRSLVPPDATLAALRRSASMAHWAVGAVETLEESECTLGSLEDGDRYRVLADRGASWCQKWVDHWLNSTLESPQLAWMTIHELVERGLCTVPRSDAYLRKMAMHLWLYRNDTLKREDGAPYVLSDFLRDHPQYLPDVWRLFEIESMGFLDVPGLWDEPEPGRYFASETWAIGLRRLSEEGLMDRRQLLEASLRGMGHDFKQNLLGGFGAFHEGLSPSTAEMVACQGHYAALLAAPSSRVVAFGMKMLKKLERVKKLDDVLFVANAANVFDKKEKGPAKSVLALYKKIAKRSPALLFPILEAIAARALVHPDVDVLEGALSFLESHAGAVDPEIRRVVTENSEALPTTLQGRGRLLGIEGAGLDSEPAVVSDGPRLAEELKGRAEALADRWRRVAGVDVALRCLESGELPEALDLDPFKYPISSAYAPIAAIATVDELFDAVSAAVEKVDEADQVERILDGISRLGTERPPGFARRAAPIVTRLKKGHGELWSVNGIANAFRDSSEMELLLYEWLVGCSLVAFPDDGAGGSNRRTHRVPTLETFQDGRLAEIRDRLRRGEVMPLLSAPTRRGGWIDPLVLVRRWSAWEAKGCVLGKYDVIQALLRLSPERRDEAVAPARALESPWASALRWALAGELQRGSGGLDEDIWIAAGRARYPFDDLVVDGEVGGYPGEPDGSRAAVYSWEAREKVSRTPAYREDTSTSMMGLKSGRGGAEVFPGDPHNARLLSQYRPTVLLHLGLGSQVDVRWNIDWAGTIWPLNRDSSYVRGIRRMLGRMGDKSTALHPNHVFLEPLMNSDEPLRDTAVLATVIGLCGLDEDLQAVGKDVVTTAIDDGRLDSAALSRAIETIAPAHWFKVNRISANLADVAPMSSLHAWVIARTLEHLAVASRTLPKDGHHIFTPLLELLTQLGLGVEPATVGALGSLKGSGKSAKLAKKLLGLEVMENGTMPEVHRMILEARIARAERWEKHGA